MSSHTTIATSIFKSFSQPKSPPPYLPRGWAVRHVPSRSRFTLQCKATSSTPRTETEDSKYAEYVGLYQNCLPVIDWNQFLEQRLDLKTPQEWRVRLIKEGVESVRSILSSMDDGEITISAYDTAWVALVEDVNGDPQFPSSIQWIANNQLVDGSWGDTYIFSAHDRIISTLACVIALKSWNMHHDKIQKGSKFIRENIEKLEDEKAEHMPIGFEVAFPSLLEIAKKLDIDIPQDHDSPALQQIYDRRNLKLTRIPKETMHKVATTLLHSLEGMPGLEWEKLLKLQCIDGSFLFSPSSTAFALIQTKDHHCLNYLKKLVKKFNGGVPNVYPVDLFERLWAVDRLQRLGISRYFELEIKECMDYVHRYWTDEGICWARNSRVHDIDDTAVGFRLLRLHGYNVSADVFQHFEKNGEFFCFVGQSNQAVTGMYNLNRASQLMFPGETILEHAKKYSSNFLHEKRAKNELFDKWIITKDLPGEVGYALDVPWYASLPRLETRFYLEHYGGDNDVWIGKTLYRMPYVNNNIYLELAKSDYNNTQALHLLEWKTIRKWYGESGLAEFGLNKRSLLLAYYLASSTVFEPERSKERLAWTKTVALIETIDSYFSKKQISREHKITFIHQFQYGFNIDQTTNGRINAREYRLVEILFSTLNQFSLDSLLINGKDIHQYLNNAWLKWLLFWGKEDYDEGQGVAELLVHTLNLCAGHYVSDEIMLLSHPIYQCLCEITNTICHQLQLSQRNKVNSKESIDGTKIESNMQELVKLVLTNCSEDDGDLDADIKNTFLDVVKSFYYKAYCSPQTINFHITKILFHKVQ